jgi:hypothetical protein
MLLFRLEKASHAGTHPFSEHASSAAHLSTISPFVPRTPCKSGVHWGVPEPEEPPEGDPPVVTISVPP